MAMADQHQVGHLGGPALGPEPQVVGVEAELGARVAAEAAQRLGADGDPVGQRHPPVVTVVRAVRDNLPAMFPGRELDEHGRLRHIPKTLIFEQLLDPEGQERSSQARWDGSRSAPRSQAARRARPAAT